MAIRRLALSVSRHCGVQKLFRWWSRGPRVLFYHGVEEKILDPALQGLQLPVAAFERQIAFLRSNREVVPIDYVYECLTGRRRLDPRCVVLTFDDGYKNNLRIVAPLLNAWKLPFTIFVSTRHISEGHRFPGYYIGTAILFTKSKSIHLRSIGRIFKLTTRAERLSARAAVVAAAKKAPQPQVEKIVAECKELLSSANWAELDATFYSEEPMNWEDVRQVHEMGATIGSHCHDHCILHSNQQEDEVYRQLNESKSMIENNVGVSGYVAYPNGKAEDISSVAYSAARSTGFCAGFTSIPGEINSTSDRFFAPRIFAVPDFEEFCYLLNQTRVQDRTLLMPVRRSDVIHEGSL
jgi:peptidoglycan/xylan/chitin deacetylase (PgdA/CDA1 family)